jgi:hypothetical protein
VRYLRNSLPRPSCEKGSALRKLCFDAWNIGRSVLNVDVYCLITLQVISLEYSMTGLSIYPKVDFITKNKSH